MTLSRRVDLPEPETPERQTKRWSGSAKERLRMLCWEALVNWRKGVGAGVEAMVAAKATPQVRFVDLNAVMTTADLVDGVHPNRAGYDKMAAVWFEALSADTHLVASANAERAVGAQ